MPVMGLTQIHLSRARELQAKLAACEDVKAAADCAQAWIDAVRQAYVAQPGADRARANELCAAARDAAFLMGAVSRAEARQLPARIGEPRVSGWRAVVPYAPAGLCALLAVWLFLGGQSNPACLAVVAAAVSLVTGRAKPASAPEMEVRAEPRVDEAELTRRLEGLFRAVDLALEAKPERGAGGAELSRGMLEAFQMLFEARMTDDPQYALRAVPQLTDALERQGVRILLYSEENKKDFDLLPAAQSGETIRPALMAGDRVIARGQATVKAYGAE